MVKVSLGKKFIERQKRFEKLPRLYEELLMVVQEGRALSLIYEFQNGIRNDDFNLIPLKEQTILRKVFKGYNKPTTPLYGKGDDNKNTYITAIRKRKLKKGFKVFFSKAKHHESGIPLNVLLLEIHEIGIIINHPSGALIRIPPRPAFSLAKKRFESKDRSMKKDIQAALKEYIKNGSMEKIKKMRSNVKALRVKVK